MDYTSNKFTVEVIENKCLNRFSKSSLHEINNKKDFKDWICALVEQICTVKTSDRFQMNSKKLYSLSSTIQSMSS